MRHFTWAFAALLAFYAETALACATTEHMAGNHGRHGAHHTAPSTLAPGYTVAMERMHRDMDISYTGDPDTDFARGMIPHHQGAVDMAAVELAHGKDPALIHFAKWVATVQPQEIAFMRHWLATKGRTATLPDAESRASTRALRRANESMHAAMNVQPTGDADIDFACGMIPHHQGAVDMAEALLIRGRTPEIQTLATEIRTSQRAEIRFLKNWLARHTGKDTCP